MAALPNGWKSITELNPTTRQYSRISTILSQGDFDALATLAIKARKRKSNLTDTGNQSSLTAIVNRSHYASGHCSLVLEVEFSDGVTWLARISLDHDKNMDNEMTTLKIVRERTTIPVPQIYAFDSTVGNPFGYQYSFMERLPGSKSSRPLVSAVPRHLRPHVAKQLANILLQLSQVTFKQIGRLAQTEEVTVIEPRKTSIENFYTERYESNREFLEQRADTESEAACWMLTTNLSRLIIPDMVTGPFPLSHQDLHFGNILFDNEFNITGIIDWSNAQAATLEDLCVLPDFALYKDRGGKFEDDVLAFKNEIAQELHVVSKNSSVHSEMAGHMARYMFSDQSELNTILHMKPAWQTLDAAQEFARVIYGSQITWKELVDMYGRLPISAMPQDCKDMPQPWV